MSGTPICPELRYVRIGKDFYMGRSVLFDEVVRKMRRDARAAVKPGASRLVRTRDVLPIIR